VSDLILTGCIPDLLQQQLPGSAKHESTISDEVWGLYLYLNNLLNQAIHTPFYLSHSVNVAEFHAVRYPRYILLQSNSLAGPGKGALCAPCIWFLNSSLSDIHLPTSTWYTTYIKGFQAYLP